MKVTNIYANSENKFVKAVKLYANTSKALHYDEAMGVKVLKADLEQLFVSGVVIADGANLMKPVALTAAGLICNNGSSVTYTAS